MSIERVFYCDWHECQSHIRTASTRPHGTFLTVTEGAGRPLHFCSWDCVLKYAAQMPPVETLPVAGGG